MLQADASFSFIKSIIIIHIINIIIVIIITTTQPENFCVCAPENCPLQGGAESWTYWATI